MAVNNALNIDFAINQLLYAPSATTLDGLATANNGVLVTSAGGVPSVGSTLPNAVQDNITRLGTITSGIWNGTVLSGTYGGTGVNNGASTITIGGNVTFSGGFTFAGTITGNTAVTFPTSGTLATTAGTVASVTGTANRITIGGTATNPTVDIAATYVGQASITTLGTIATGVWNGTVVGMTYGGSGANLVPSNGGIIYSNATTMAVLSGTATANQVLLSGSTAAPAWSTATYPATTSVSEILYSSSANVIAGITTANNGVLITSAGGVPSISSTLPSAVQGNITSVGTIASGTWNGSIITGTYGGTGVNNGASTITIGGNVTFSGGFTFAGTITGNTAVTFPTSGTLATTAGTVASVTGTANRISIGGTGTNPTVDIDAAYVGQASITTLGTITTGTWTGTTIAIANGGTGGTTNTAAINNLVSNASLTSATVASGDLVLIQDISDTNNLKSVTAQAIANLAGSVAAAATQAEMEAASSTSVFASPGRMQYWPGSPKFWVRADTSGGITSSYNITSVTDTAVGVIDVTIATDFSDTTWTLIPGGMYTPGGAAATTRIWNATGSVGAGTLQCSCLNGTFGSADPDYWTFTGFGDQA